MQISNMDDKELLQEIGRRFEEKKASIDEMDFMTKKLLDLNDKNKNSQEVKSKFLSLIKNEFNNPMSSLLNLVNMMVKQNLDEKTIQLSSMMQDELLKLDFSLKNIFAASEIEAGETANDYSSVNIEEVYKEVVAYFKNIINEKSLLVKFNTTCSDSIVSDAQKLYLILFNLISNACEYSYENSEISVTCECDKDTYTIKVMDSGEGVYAEHTKEIYNRFAHFETGKTRATAGLGLGLSVVRGMAEALDGTIDNVKQDDLTIFIVKVNKVDEDILDISTGVGANEFLFEDNNEMVEF